MPIAWRYSARIDNLRKDGYRIRASHIDKSIWRFTLLPQDPQQPQALQVAAELDEPKYLDFNEQLRTYVSGTAPGFVDSLT
ncbi:hypothetical protein [Arthrobacter oryzae]|uniref:hypothetical protein n=1 Tax=Arthrobacter oryzae TaxID=409290 RepID=UPI002789DB30|nr:hypothetical protein [Arthrobacter oryzae]